MLVLLFAALGSALGAVPSGYTPTWNLSRSTIAMPCNYETFFDVQLTAKFGLVSFDWSNAKALWANARPMNCEELLVEQAAMVKAVNPDTHVWVYRNLVKALPWYTDVQVKINDPAYAGMNAAEGGRFPWWRSTWEQSSS